MDERRLLIAALLSLAVLIIWQVAFPPPKPEPAPTPAPVERSESFASDVDELEPSTEPTTAELEGAAEPAAEPAPAAEIEEIAADAEERVVVERPGYRAELTNRGAELVSFRLDDHRDKDGAALDMVRARSAAPYPLALAGTAGELGAVLWRVERYDSDRGDPIVEFRYSGPEGRASKKLTFGAEGLLDVDVAVEGERSWGLMLGPGVRNPSAEELGDRFARRAGIYLLGEELERVDAQGADEPTVVLGTGLRWVGLQDSYFLSAWLADGGLERAQLTPMVDMGDEGGARFVPRGPDGDGDRNQELELALYPGGERLTGRLYLGAKQYDRLQAIGGQGLEQTVGLGFFSFLARPLMIGLNWIYANVVQNYGWAIILMTLLLKIVLFPLTHKSTVSMKRMQKLNPKIQGIRNKYRPKLKDKKGRPNPEMQRKMNEEIMALYKSEGVNPAGGCLPMLLQIPVLFAFYNLLTAAVELRGAPWMGWIEDLSSPDPLYVLPIVMGASQFVQQKLTPAAGDPMQRRIFMLMPVFFTVLFLNFPAGLVLYWLTNNVLTIAQQGIYNRFSEDSDDAKPAAGKQPKRAAKQ